jgi:hypothetical protein
MVKLKKDPNRKPTPHLDKVFDDLKQLAKLNQIRLFESFVEPYEILIVSNYRFPNSFLV